MSMSRCFECDVPAECDHHVVPRSMGGTKTVPFVLSSRRELVELVRLVRP